MTACVFKAGFQLHLKRKDIQNLLARSVTKLVSKTGLDGFHTRGHEPIVTRIILIKSASGDFVSMSLAMKAGCSMIVEMDHQSRVTGRTDHR